MPEIKYIKNKDIDVIRWDKCISRSHNGNVFAFSWYLDSVCENWDALVVDNYKAVFPLPIKKVLGLKIIYLPLFVNKLNLYVSDDYKLEIKEELFSVLIQKRLFLNIQTENQSLILKKYAFTERKAYHIDLIRSYVEIESAYSTFFKEQLSVAAKNKVFYNTGILPNGLVLLASITQKLSKKNQNRLRMLSAVSLRKNKGEIYGAFNDKNRLIAVVLFVKSHYNTNIIAAFQSKEAKKKRALFGLINHYIKTNSEKAETLDFFGLNSMSLEFFKGLGAKEYPYYNIRKRFLF